MKTPLIFFLLSVSLFAQPFQNLETLKVDENIFIQYNPAVTDVINRKVQNEMGDEYTLIQTIIDPETSRPYMIEFNYGPSDDPTFIIYEETSGGYERIGEIYALFLAIPSNGNIYCGGHTNNMFDQRRKFTIENRQLVETPQPYYYVGLETVTTAPFELYNDMLLTEKIAQIPAGYEITVLINKKDRYLIKTAFGLTGWISAPMSMMDTPMEGYPEGATGIKGLYYNGD